ncbi:polysaccharide pyruvyl transferase family protein [Lachnospiraceae bacterium 54-11]
MIFINVLYYDNCWFTNVGEAFIDIGAMNIIRKLFPNANIANISNMSKYYVPQERNKIFKKQNNETRNYKLLNTLDYFEFEYLVLAGMFMSEKHLEGEVCEFVKAASCTGKKIVFLGLGQEARMQDESVEEYRKYLHFIKPVLVVTRDRKTYKNLCGGGIKMLQGIDAAFWVKDSYDPRGFSVKEYDIVSFCRSDEPEGFGAWPYPIIRPYHFQWSARDIRCKKNTFISDIPYDYITLYANAHKVYTDLVHATIISLQYGKEVEYFYTDDRSDAFLDIPFLYKKDRSLRMDEDELDKFKNELVGKMIQAISS